MAKKDFRNGLDGLIHSSLPEEKNTDKEKKIIPTKFEKATYYFESNQLNEIKAIAFFTRRPIGKVLAEAMGNYIKVFPELNEAKDLFEKDNK